MTQCQAPDNRNGNGKVGGRSEGDGIKQVEKGHQVQLEEMKAKFGNSGRVRNKILGKRKSETR